MKKIRLFSENLLDDITPSVKNPAAVNYPLSNLFHDWFTKYTRTTGVDDEWWKWNLGASTPITGIMFKGHNFRVGATVTIQVSSADNDTWNVYNSAFAITAAALEKELVYVFWETPQNAWRIRLSVQDAGNPLAYLKLGKPWAGVHFEPSVNFNNAYARALEDSSSLIRTVDGYHFATKVSPKLVSLNYRFENITNVDRLALLDVFDKVGWTDTYFILQDADDAINNLYYGLNLDNVWTFPHNLMDNDFNFSFSFKESR